MTSSITLKFLVKILRKPVHKITKTYPTMGFWNPIFSPYLVRNSRVLGCGLNRYFKICPIHQTMGSPWRRDNRGSKSLGMESGRYGGRGLIESITGRLITCVSSWPVNIKLNLFSKVTNLTNTRRVS